MLIYFCVKMSRRPSHSAPSHPLLHPTTLLTFYQHYNLKRNQPSPWAQLRHCSSLTPREARWPLLSPGVCCAVCPQHSPNLFHLVTIPLLFAFCLKSHFSGKWPPFIPDPLPVVSSCCSLEFPFPLIYSIGNFL